MQEICYTRHGKILAINGYGNLRVRWKIQRKCMIKSALCVHAVVERFKRRISEVRYLEQGRCFVGMQ